MGKLDGKVAVVTGATEGMALERPGASLKRVPIASSQAAGGLVTRERIERKFAYTRLITENLPALLALYGELLGISSQDFGNPGQFAAFPLDGATLWLFSRTAAKEAHGED